MNILVTGINGFIGSHFLEYALRKTDWDVAGVDVTDSYVSRYEDESRFRFYRYDIAGDLGRVKDLIAGADVVLLLAGIARPSEYIEHPLQVFELDFESNYRLVKLCAEMHRRVIFPSTSEVYGIGGSLPMNEDSSPLTLGPIWQMRWIYSNSKQMMDRVIFALSKEMGLRFTLIRPFNWTGPRLDTFEHAERHQARLLTQMIHDVLYRHEIILVGDGEQRRSFTWIGEGIEAIATIIREEEKSDGQIFNIGNPANNCSVKELSDILLAEMSSRPEFRDAAAATRVKSLSPDAYYGKAYADTKNRIPDVGKIKNVLGWEPHATTAEIVSRTLDYLSDGE